MFFFVCLFVCLFVFFSGIKVKLVDKMMQNTS